jgi:hypothetical protein
MPVPRPMEESTPRPTHHTTYCSQASASCTSVARAPLALRPLYTSSRGTRRKRVAGWLASQPAPRAAEAAVEAANADSVRSGERSSVSRARCSFSCCRSCGAGAGQGSRESSSGQLAGGRQGQPPSSEVTVGGGRGPPPQPVLKHTAAARCPARGSLQCISTATRPGGRAHLLQASLLLGSELLDEVLNCVRLLPDNGIHGPSRLVAAGAAQRLPAGAPDGEAAANSLSRV